MNFNDYRYEHLDLEKIKGEFSELIDSFEKSENVEGQIEAFDKIIKLRNHIETMQTLVSIRHSIDTNDEFYDKENEYMDEISPICLDLLMIFIKRLSIQNLRMSLLRNMENYCLTWQKIH